MWATSSADGAIQLAVRTPSRENLLKSSRFRSKALRGVFGVLVEKDCRVRFGDGLLVGSNNQRRKFITALR